MQSVTIAKARGWGLTLDLYLGDSGGVFGRPDATVIQLLLELLEGGLGEAHLKPAVLSQGKLHWESVKSVQDSLW